MNTMHVKKGDTVLVLTGKDKGKQGKVLACSPSSGRCSVEGVNIITKHQKARKQGDQSSIVKKEGTIDASNVQIVCPECGKATRVNNVVAADGKKHRSCKKCGKVIDLKRNVEKDKKEKVKEKPVKETKAKKPSEKKADAEVKPAKEVKAKKEDAAAAKQASPAAEEKPKAKKAPAAKQASPAKTEEESKPE